MSFGFASHVLLGHDHLVLVRWWKFKLAFFETVQQPRRLTRFELIELPPAYVDWTPRGQSQKRFHSLKAGVSKLRRVGAYAQARPIFFLNLLQYLVSFTFQPEVQVTKPEAVVSVGEVDVGVVHTKLRIPGDVLDVADTAFDLILMSCEMAVYKSKPSTIDGELQADRALVVAYTANSCPP